MTHDLNSHVDWLYFYEDRARDLPIQSQNDYNTVLGYLYDFSRNSLESRAIELRESDSYTRKKFGTALAGLVPFVKPVVSIELAEDFADETLRAFGLKDADGIQDLAARFQQKHGGRDLIWAGMAREFAKISIPQLIREAGFGRNSSASHIVPVARQLMSAGTGYVMVRKRMLNIIDRGLEIALDVHARLFIPLVLSKLSRKAEDRRPPHWQGKN